MNVVGDDGESGEWTMKEFFFISVFVRTAEWYSEWFISSFIWVLYTVNHKKRDILFSL